MSTSGEVSTPVSVPDCAPAATSCFGASCEMYDEMSLTHSGVMPFNSLPSSQAITVGSSTYRLPVNGLTCVRTLEMYCLNATRTVGSVKNAAPLLAVLTPSQRRNVYLPPW